jgi:hypothetical protein
VETSVVAEEWAAHGRPTPLLGSSVLAGTALLASGDAQACAGRGPGAGVGLFTVSVEQRVGRTACRSNSVSVEQRVGRTACRSNSVSVAELRTEQGQRHGRRWHTRWVEVSDA